MERGCNYVHKDEYCLYTLYNSTTLVDTETKDSPQDEDGAASVSSISNTYQASIFLEVGVYKPRKKFAVPPSEVDLTT